MSTVTIDYAMKMGNASRMQHTPYLTALITAHKAIII